MKRPYSRIFEMARIYSAYRAGRNYCAFSPSRLWVELTNSCNLNCTMCLNKSLPKDSFGFMDFGVYKKIIDEISGKVYDIYLHHRGESLLHPQLFQMISYAKEHNIHTRLHTNATLLGEEKAAGIINSGLDFISFSFDGYDKETYEDIRRGANFEKTLANIIGFLKLKQSMKSRHPFTAFTIIEFPAKGVSGAVKKEFLSRFQSLPLDAIRIRKAHNWGGSYNALAGRKCPGFIPCTFLWYALTIFWDGTVVPCPQDFFGRLKLGNVKDSSLLGLWNSKKQISLRKMMHRKASIDIEPCRNCDRLYRRNILGVPLDEISAFLRDNLSGYRVRGKLH